MTKSQAFRQQAESDFAVFELLLAEDRVRVPECHPLYYLRVAAEKLAKAAIIAADPSYRETNHEPAQRFLQALRRPDMGEALGADDWDLYQLRLRKVLDAYVRLETLSPKRTHRPNVEYPWPTGQEWQAPASHVFGLLGDSVSPDGAILIDFMRLIIEHFGSLPLADETPSDAWP